MMQSVVSGNNDGRNVKKYIIEPDEAYIFKRNFSEGSV